MNGTFKSFKEVVTRETSLLSVLDSLIAKKSVLAAYFYLMAEIQQTQHQKK
jgi:hypothetical protein